MSYWIHNKYVQTAQARERVIESWLVSVFHLEAEKGVEAFSRTITERGKEKPTQSKIMLDAALKNFA